MTPVKKSLFALLAFGLTAAAPFACAQDAAAPAAPAATADQTPPPPPKGKKGRDPMRMVMSKVDNVTDDQKAKIADITKDAMAKGKDIRDDSTLSDDDKAQKMKDNMKAEADQVRALLTPDQQTQFDDALKAAMKGGKRRKKADDGSGAPPPPPPADGSAPPPPPPSM